MAQAIHNGCIQLFCIPHAAGSAGMFGSWKENLPDHIQLVPLELAGRGRRFNDPLYPDFEAALHDLHRELLKHRPDQPYALLGHSMGSLLAYELAMRLQEEGGQAPAMLFLGGQKPPHRFSLGPRYSGLSDDELWSILLEGSQTPWDEHQYGDQIRDMYLPILRADLNVCDTYQHIEGRSRYTGPVVIMNGAEDESIQGEQQEWYELVNAPCHTVTFQGGHYFIYEHQDRVISTVIHYLKGVI
ncbi:alpha/beta fold hydrolase [Paenibacillus sp. P96]|uniref:Alpha/beta fold hydrolase n=1 Tax=Paenibacillus zeirhizosphaerae TaxID=2987519 RepID=A0ABT9FVY2_9BACL|nr:alpha/beta fold hydrolase [Paenibacillus sp. P96]MDP4098850.1 alpha/beta fold hydrolase [Paenibacillus sp. P96]